MSKKQKRKLGKIIAYSFIALFFITALLFSFFTGFSIGLVLSIESIAKEKSLIAQHDKILVNCPVGLKEYEGGIFTSKILLPAVLRDNTGVTAYAKVTVVPNGSGNILFNTGNVLVNPDTQQSIRKAALVASNITNISIECVDLIYDLYADAALLEGPSAGAAFTIATIAALKQENISTEVMITGAINHDGTIGPSGKILEKAKAAKQAGAKLFLVPPNLATDINVTVTEFCKVYGTYEYCDPEFTTTIKDVEKEAGIKIIEVGNIQDAYEYFIDPSLFSNM